MKSLEVDKYPETVEKYLDSMLLKFEEAGSKDYTKLDRDIGDALH